MPTFFLAPFPWNIFLLPFILGVLSITHGKECFLEGAKTWSCFSVQSASIGISLGNGIY